MIFSISLYADNFGLLLFNGNCVTCHNETKSISAPSMLEVQKRYKNAFPSEKDFIENMSLWVEHPNKTTSIMVESIDKYKLMPELGFDRSVLKDITKFIYRTDFSKSNK